MKTKFLAISESSLASIRGISCLEFSYHLKLGFVLDFGRLLRLGNSYLPLAATSSLNYFSHNQTTSNSVTISYYGLAALYLLVYLIISTYLAPHSLDLLEIHHRSQYLKPTAYISRLTSYLASSSLFLRLNDYIN